jgi:hypothetical protein
MSIARTIEEGSLLVGQRGDRLSERRPAAFHERGQIPFKVVGPHIPRLNAETQTMAQPIKTLAQEYRTAISYWPNHPAAKRLGRELA